MRHAYTVIWTALFGTLVGCEADPEDEKSIKTQESTISMSEPAGGDMSAVPRAVTCQIHKYHTVGCIDCTGSGEVRIFIDCKAPQITDYTGDFVRYSGSTHLCGECDFGINFVSYDVR